MASWSLLHYAAINFDACAKNSITKYTHIDTLSQGSYIIKTSYSCYAVPHHIPVRWFRSGTSRTWNSQSETFSNANIQSHTQSASKGQDMYILGNFIASKNVARDIQCMVMIGQGKHCFAGTIHWMLASLLLAIKFAIVLLHMLVSKVCVFELHSSAHPSLRGR